MLRKKRCYEVLEDRRLLAAQGFDLVQAFQADITRQSFVTDVDQDGLDDIVMAFRVQGDVQWKRNRADVAGQGDVFDLARTMFHVPGGFSAMAAADLDGNGKVDFLAASETYSWFLSNDVDLDYQPHSSEIRPLAPIQKLVVSDADANGNRFVVAASESHVELLSFDTNHQLTRLDTIDVRLYRPERMQLADWD
ncbi:MAG: VCBS repeat-containing protein, partial [Planctomycetales bacterium]|nr:VCBS repeat-containing protein [Planctomycetales bacterium]